MGMKKVGIRNYLGPGETSESIHRQVVTYARPSLKACIVLKAIYSNYVCMCECIPVCI